MKKLIKKFGTQIVLMAVGVKKLIVIFSVVGLNSAGIRFKAGTLSDNLDEQVITWGAMDPPKSDMRTLVTAGGAIASQKAVAQALVKSLVLQERANAKDITNMVRDHWLTKIQNNVGVTLEKIVGLGLAAKGFGIPQTMVRFKTTWPEPISVDNNIPMRLALELIGNDVLSKGKPFGAVSIGAYRQIGGVAPLRNDHPLASLILPFSKMLFKDIFVVGDKDKTAYYIFFWVDKDGNPGPESPVFPYTITK